MEKELKDLKSLNGKNIEVENVSSYLSKIKELSNGNVVLFRGHSDKGWDLIPSIGRKNKEKGHYFYDKKNEEQIFLEFKRNYYLYTYNRPSSDIDILFLAQHFGVPTRLLDWTYNPLIALYFACQASEEEKEGCVYTLVVPQKQSLIKEGHDFDKNFYNMKKYKKDHYLLIPDYTNRRFLNQKGMFLLFKDPYTKIDLQPTFIIKNKRNVLEELVNLGVTESMVLPTLDSLGREIKNKYMNL